MTTDAVRSTVADVDLDAIADNVAAIRARAGADVIAVQPLRTSQVGRYAHKVNEHAVVRPYRAVLRLTGVAGDRVVQAIGQSRSS